MTFSMSPGEYPLPWSASAIASKRASSPNPSVYYIDSASAIARDLLRLDAGDVRPMNPARVGVDVDRETLRQKNENREHDRLMLPPPHRPVKERSESDHGDARERRDGPAQKEHDEKDGRERDEHGAPESRERHPKVLAGKDP